MRILLTTVLFLGVFRGMAQDPHFSQYYAAPTYLNPAFAGTGADHRFIANYRNQWPDISNGFITYAFSYDLPYVRSAQWHRYTGHGRPGRLGWATIHTR